MHLWSASMEKGESAVGARLQQLPRLILPPHARCRRGVKRHYEPSAIMPRIRWLVNESTELGSKNLLKFNASQRVRGWNEACCSILTRDNGFATRQAWNEDIHTRWCVHWIFWGKIHYNSMLYAICRRGIPNFPPRMICTATNAVIVGYFVVSYIVITICTISRRSKVFNCE